MARMILILGLALGFWLKDFQMDRGTYAGSPSRGDVQVMDGSDPYHVKLIQIITENAQKFNSLEQWNFRIRCLLQHPGIKRQPAQFPVDQFQPRLLGSLFLFLFP